MCPHVVQDVSCFLEALQTRPDIFNMSYGRARSEICLGWNRGCNRGLKCSDLCTFALQSTNHKVSWDQFLLHTKQNYFTMSPQMSFQYRELLQLWVCDDQSDVYLILVFITCRKSALMKSTHAAETRTYFSPSVRMRWNWALGLQEPYKRKP